MTITPATTNAAPAVAIPAPRETVEHAALPAVPAAAEPSAPAAPAGPAGPAGGAPAAVDPCRCGHEKDLHEHYRAGTDCSACGVACTAFRARTGRGVRAGVSRIIRRARRTA